MRTMRGPGTMRRPGMTCRITRLVEQTVEQAAWPTFRFARRSLRLGRARIGSCQHAEEADRASLALLRLLAGNLLDYPGLVRVGADGVGDFGGRSTSRKRDHQQSCRNRQESRSNKESAVAAVHAYISRCVREETYSTSTSSSHLGPVESNLTIGRIQAIRMIARPFFAPGPFLLASWTVTLVFRQC